MDLFLILSLSLPPLLEMYNDDAVFVRAFFPPISFFFGDVSRNKESGGVLERVTSRW